MEYKDELQKRRIFNSCIEIQELEIPIFLERKKGKRMNEFSNREMMFSHSEAGRFSN